MIMNIKKMHKRRVFALLGVAVVMGIVVMYNVLELERFPLRSLRNDAQQAEWEALQHKHVTSTL